MNKIMPIVLVDIVLIFCILAGTYYYVLMKNPDISLDQMLRGDPLKSVEWLDVPKYIGDRCKEIPEFSNEKVKDDYLLHITKSNTYLDAGKNTTLSKFIGYNQVGKNGKIIGSDIGPSCWFILIGDTNGVHGAAFETDVGTTEIVKVKNYIQETIPPITN